MSFDVPADSYSRFMGRFSLPLARQFVDFADVRPGQRALDVGCGPGILTRVLVERLGGASVAAIDPSPPFVAATAAAYPEVAVTRGSAEDLPYADDGFDRTLAQLVVHFMSDPVAGLREMARVTAPGGLVATSVWDYEGGTGPLTTFWNAVAELHAGHRGESDLPGARQGHLVELCTKAGLHDVVEELLTVTCHFATFEEWWEPYTLGVGPAGVFVAGLGDSARAALRDRCRELLPTAPFTVSASAWCVRATP